jgi:predicted TPR repeat methyltransferase
MQTAPVFLSSGDLVADRRYQWALDYAARGDRAAAAEILEQVLESAPAFASAWFALAELRELQGDRDGAIAALRTAAEADPQDYHGARLHLARLGAGELTAAMTATYVRRVFDAHAARFEESLLQRLDYRGPQLLLEAVLGLDRGGGAAAASAGRDRRFASMLDLGCGTGLAGEAFRSHVDHLAGIDLSAAMVGEARRKAIYDRLATGDLAEFLAAEAAAAARHDLIIAADVFVYVADLAPVAAAAARVLAPAGLFAFTVETHCGDGVILRETLRYAHGAQHVRAALAAAGLDLASLREVATRTEKGEPVPGLLAIAGAGDLIFKTGAANAVRET